MKKKLPQKSRGSAPIAKLKSLMRRLAARTARASLTRNKLLSLNETNENAPLALSQNEI